MTEPEKKPRLTLKSLDSKIDRVVRALKIGAACAVLIGVGALVGIGVFLVRTAGEEGRTCDSIDSAITAVSDVYFGRVSATRSQSLPPRTSEEQAAYESLIADVRGQVDDALAECGG